MKIKTSLLALALAAVGAGCGQTSYFEVTVAVSTSAPVTCLSTIDHCEVTVHGAGGERFVLDNNGRNVCHMPTVYNLGLFQYATDQDAGNVSFHVALVDGNLHILGEADSDTKPIKTGGRQSESVTITTAATCQ